MLLTSNYTNRPSENWPARDAKRRTSRRSQLRARRTCGAGKTRSSGSGGSSSGGGSTEKTSVEESGGGACVCAAPAASCRQRTRRRRRRRISSDCALSQSPAAGRAHLHRLPQCEAVAPHLRLFLTGGGGARRSRRRRRGWMRGRVGEEELGGGGETRREDRKIFSYAKLYLTNLYFYIYIIVLNTYISSTIIRGILGSIVSNLIELYYKIINKKFH